MNALCVLQLFSDYIHLTSLYDMHYFLYFTDKETGFRDVKWLVQDDKANKQQHWCSKLGSLSSSQPHAILPLKSS